MKKNIYHLGIFFFALLITLIGYLSYIQIYQGTELANNPHNKRLIIEMNKIQRGTIYDRRGAILAKTTWENNQNIRSYPQGKSTAHIIGYLSPRYGASGLEGVYAENLLGKTPESKMYNLWRQIQGKKPEGEDLILTLDQRVQDLGTSLLGNATGAAVVLDPRTGAVLSAVSSPTFNPATIDTNWSTLINDQNAPLLNRAFQSGYPPGSVMKIITGSAALTDGHTKEDVFHSDGYLVINGYKLTDHFTGNATITDALAYSSNVIYAKLALEMGNEKFTSMAEKFGFNQKTNFPLEVKTSTLSNNKTMTEPQLAASAIGQGEVLASPLHMALVAATIANDGIMMQPYLVQEIHSPQGATVFSQQPKEMQRVIDSNVANIMRDGMVAVVQKGTGTSAGIQGIQVAGKTGTAENKQGQPHAWFVGFAPAENPRVAVAVIVENSGYGGTAAAPIARQLILEALR